MRAEQFLEVRILQSSFNDPRHITGSGILIFGAQTVAVRKLGVGTAHTLDPFVHLLDEGLLIRAHMLRNSHSRVVGPFQEHAVQQIPQCQDFALFQLCVLCTGGKIFVITAADCHFVIQIAVLNGHNGCHDFGKCTGLQLQIRVVGINNRTGIDLIGKSGHGSFHHSGIGTQRHLCINRPAAVHNGNQTVVNFHAIVHDLAGQRRCHSRFLGFRGIDRNQEHLCHQKDAQQQSR